ncbi:DNA-binding response regulator [Enemella evansiae]|uniref:response regulator transcription factor n=1 Tax=Enemella evansiae TaxID=2016499 RepID=UPI000B9699DF|nr:response regulator transcription factor [Enemella evansiae]OYO10004.1 DNA-binding response regulator [Enemella evansiae]
MRVVVADDQALVREGIVTVLSLAEGIEVVGQAGDGAQAVRLVRETVPEVVLMDLRMPVLDGVAATAEILAALPKTRVLVLTTFADDASIKGALDAGACGYLTKDASGSEVVAAVQAAAAGRTPLDTRIAGRVVAGLPDAEPRSLRDRFPELTDREAEVLRLIAEGRTNPEIAADLVLGVSTIKSHVNAIFAKLGVADRRAAIERVARGS